ncbi:hypothetical protein [Ruminococcus sp.]|jgi:hypothetical protein|uniref:hypothetical protein n=1 Tax=Ruminococcus sp. TaxID=41978 RepID=UPI0025FDBC08|nr:hypothetical protein [Ruminococcus sp.]
MSNLLAEGFRRLFKGKRFYVVLTIIMAIPAAACIFIKIFEDSTVNVGDGIVFGMIGTMTMFISVTVGLFIIHDFKNNTIRNKIIIGHSRTNIYLANLIISLVVAFIYQLAYWLVLIVFSKTLQRFESFPCKEIFVNMLFTIVILFAFTSFFVFLCTSIRSTGGFVLSLMLDTIVTMIAGIVYMFVKNELVRDIIDYGLPSTQIDCFKYAPTTVSDNLMWMILVDIGICIVSTIAGIAIFKKSDLK